MFAGEDGLYMAASGATLRATGRQVWGPPFPERRQPLLFLASEVPGSVALLLLQASQLSSPAQKQVISVVKAAMDFGFCLAEVSGEPFVADAVLKGC